MAAILFESIGKLCSLPCQACAACVKGCGAVCGDVCRGCGPCCTECCKGLAVVCRSISTTICSPFFPYIFLTAVLNLPPTIWGIQARPGCNPSMWLWVNAAFCLLHMVVALYAVTRILAARNNSTSSNSAGTGTTTTAAATTGMVAVATTNTAAANDTTTKTATGGGDLERQAAAAAAAATASPRLRSRVTNLFTHERSYGESSSSSATNGGREQMKQVLCYDPIIALYLLGLMGWLAWLFFGGVAFANGDDADDNDDDDESRCDNNRNAVLLSISCGFAYAMLVCCTIPCAYACLR